MADSSVAFRALNDAKPLPRTPSRCFIVPSKGSIKRYYQMITISHIFFIIIIIIIISIIIIRIIIIITNVSIRRRP